MHLNRTGRRILLACTIVAIAGCNKPSAPHASATAAAPAGLSPASTSIDSPYFAAAAPTPAELKTMHLNYDTFSMGENGEYLDFVPLPPHSGDVAIEVKKVGAYKMKLVSAKCAYDVRVSPPEGPPFVMNPTTPTNKFIATKPGRLTVHMDSSAANNYSCNINLAPMQILDGGPAVRQG